MHVIKDLSEFKQNYQSCVATIGKYDGMHLGHQRLLSRVLLEASALSIPSLVILSEPQPEEFFAGDRAPARLNHFEDKVKFLQGFGIDIVYCMQFNKTLSQYSAEHFIDEVLVSGLGIKCLIVGDDFRFGKDRRGDFSLLKASGIDKGFEVAAEGSYLQGGERVSSTLVRTTLENGEFEKVKQLLGAYYSISGEVVQGRQLGRELGSPTANVKLESEKLALHGIFIVKVNLNGRELSGVASIGYNPTVSAEQKISLEVHILDFSEEIYGESISVSFLRKIRDEEKFASIDALKQKIAEDIKQARDYFKC